MKNYEVINYPDGSFYVKVSEFLEEVEFKINSYDDLWVLKQLKDVYDFNKKPLSIFIPNLLDAQADRRFNKNEPHGLKLVCEFINSLKFEKVSIFHPHNPEVIEALIDGVEIIDNSIFIIQVLDRLKANPFNPNSKNIENMVLISSDAGGFKPLMKLCDKINWTGETFSATKARDYVDGKSKLTQNVGNVDFGGKDVLIIDDICVYGGTFIGLYNLLKDKNVGKLYLAVSHITVKSPNRELEKFDGVFTTNSKYDEYDLNSLTIINCL